MFACFCLNILIETGPPSDFQRVTADSLNLSEREKREDFFKQELLRVGRLISIRKVHSGIVQTRDLESWTVTRCANCECHSHAIHRESGTSFVLIYRHLLDSEAIENLKASDLFSPIHKIVVNPNSDILDDVDFESSPTREVLMGITQLEMMMNEYLAKETLDVAHKLEAYKDQLYDQLEKKRERAEKEHVHLATMVQITFNWERSQANMAAAAVSPPRLDSLADEALSSSFNRQLNNGHSPRQGSPTDMMRRQPRSFDAEGVFDFEGSDNAPSRSSTEHNDSDAEGGNKEPDELFAPRPVNRGRSREIAQSLPVDIPTFMQSRHRSTEDLEDVAQGETVNIPESMARIAQSVHGDAVFGDLPRPRVNNDE